MLDQFVISNRDTIIARTQTRVASRVAARLSDTELTSGVPIFLDQLVEALRLAEANDAIDHAEIGKSAGQYGHHLQRMGLTIGQVVHGYGDVCQSITSLALEQDAPISTDEFRTLNLCLDNAIAEAVAAYSRISERTLVDQETERLGAVAHDLRNVLNGAMLSFNVVQNGKVAPGGSTGRLHARSLLELRDLIDRSLTDVRLDAGIEQSELISVAALLGEIEVAASLQAQMRGLNFVTTSVDRTVMIEGDRQILTAAISNLVQNAFKFTCNHGTVSLTTRTTADRVLFDVEDECGGLSPGKEEALFHGFKDRSGLGLGLSICLKAAAASAGEIYVLDLPGKGCIFTLDLPRKPPPPPSLVGDDATERTGRGAGGACAQM